MVPLKGQLTCCWRLSPKSPTTVNGGLTPTPPESVGIHMMPRSDGIVLGGVSLRGVWDLAEDDTERRRVVEAHMAFYAAMAANRRT